MKKKVLVLMVSVMVVCGLLAGCGDSSDSKQLNRIETEVSRISEKLDKSEASKAETDAQVTADNEKNKEELLEAKEEITELESQNAILEEKVEELEKQLKETKVAESQNVTGNAVTVDFDYGDYKFTEKEGKLYEITNSHPHLYTTPECKHEDEIIEIPYLISSTVDIINYKEENLNVVKSEDGTYLFSYETIGVQQKRE